MLVSWVAKATTCVFPKSCTHWAWHGMAIAISTMIGSICFIFTPSRIFVIRIRSLFEFAGNMFPKGILKYRVEVPYLVPAYSTLVLQAYSAFEHRALMYRLPESLSFHWPDWEIFRCCPARLKQQIEPRSSSYRGCSEWNGDT